MNNNKNNAILCSQTIAFLRFPLIIGVVFIHSLADSGPADNIGINENCTYPVYTTISYLFSRILPLISVPLFFFFSGFLFFHVAAFNKEIYVRKLKKRVRALLIPYVIWNLLYLLLIFTIQSIAPETISKNTVLIKDYRFSELIESFWIWKMANVEGPINISLWFIRDLMVMIVLSPGIYFILKKLKHYALVIFGIFYISEYWFSIPGFSIPALFFFSSGAYFSIYKKDFIQPARHHLFVFGILYFLLTTILLVFHQEKKCWITYVTNLYILIGILFTIGLTAHFIAKGKWKMSSFLSESSFFIYVSHFAILERIIKVLYRSLHPHTDGMLLLIYFVCPVITVCIGLSAYYLLRRYLPKTTALLTGNR